MGISVSATTSEKTTAIYARLQLETVAAAVDASTAAMAQAMDTSKPALGVLYKYRGRFDQGWDAQTRAAWYQTTQTTGSTR
mgnify:CR=1 FL=1